MILACLAVSIAVVLVVYLWLEGPLGENFHQVTTDLYRSGQLDPHALASRIRRHGIHTVINLRGANPGKPWYDRQRAIVARLGVRHVDIGFSGRRPLAPELVRLLIRALGEEPRPILVQCLGGADRSGVVAALEWLLRGGDNLDAARRELSFLPYGYVGWDRFRHMAEFVDRYAGYRASGGTLGLADWVDQVYATAAAR